jgi:hypothetical protein
MNRSIRLLPWLAATAVLCAPSLASAEVESTQKTATGHIYKFLDDLLDSDVIGPKGGAIIVRKKAYRTTLIRPRTSFVQEMFKSVEDI